MNLKSSFRIIFLVSFMISLVSAKYAAAQTNYEDVVYLKNGSVIHGMIIEQIPNESIKIRTADRNIFVFRIDEIEKMTKEEVQQISQPVYVPVRLRIAELIPTSSPLLFTRAPPEFPGLIAASV